MNLNQYIRYKNLKDNLSIIKAKFNKIDETNPYYDLFKVMIPFSEKALKDFVKLCHKDSRKIK